MRVHVATRGLRAPVPRRLLEAAGRAALRAIGAPADAELEVALVDDATMARLHRRFLGARGSTDVMTFPGDGGADRILGEVVISVGRARVQAREAGWAVRREVTLLLVHGVLHLGGYDDHTPAQAARMRAAERRILAQIFRTRR
ncbi:MAG: rRNA maturation RNase YbeY [Armatimonadota bacterium]|nr:rRNA maturation RNase YbeY [Armatimonadota bacterium]